jgi:hypothetical protein
MHINININMAVGRGRVCTYRRRRILVRDGGQYEASMGRQSVGGGLVLFVGDGLSDLAALLTADVGIILTAQDGSGVRAADRLHRPAGRPAGRPARRLAGWLRSPCLRPRPAASAAAAAAAAAAVASEVSQERSSLDWSPPMVPPRG